MTPVTNWRTRGVILRITPRSAVLAVQTFTFGPLRIFFCLLRRHAEVLGVRISKVLQSAYAMNSLSLGFSPSVDYALTRRSLPRIFNEQLDSAVLSLFRTSLTW